MSKKPQGGWKRHLFSTRNFFSSPLFIFLFPLWESLSLNKNKGAECRDQPQQYFLVYTAKLLLRLVICPCLLSAKKTAETKLQNSPKHFVLSYIATICKLQANSYGDEWLLPGSFKFFQDFCCLFGFFN